MTNIMANLLVGNLGIAVFSLVKLYYKPEEWVWTIVFAISMVCSVWIAVKDPNKK
ncbi:hypothetical protein [Paraflavitalea sp. CAU 1676]|uniref:hypothetical protein n=1 Tax=Paraflavitalea sp. CAU 1676 TaxID=3032598 RepID=UPI0023D99980|nr:hypothetical protein [Paraflavitalea sp. CAU 1676]MDF2189725.1 hypothetical protein [Paraflavitalea sp. CAU 1676]